MLVDPMNGTTECSMDIVRSPGRGEKRVDSNCNPGASKRECHSKASSQHIGPIYGFQQLAPRPQSVLLLRGSTCSTLKHAALLSRPISPSTKRYKLEVVPIH